MLSSSMKVLGTGLVLMAMVVGSIGCESEYKERDGSADTPKTKDGLLEEHGQQAVQEFRTKAPAMKRFFDTAYAYAVFPEIAKGGAGIGGAHGNGVVFRKDGQVVGYAEMGQATIGLQLGGQTYKELIFFQTPEKFRQFKSGEMQFAAEAAAVAADKAADANYDYTEGVAVFTMDRKGLMGEAAIGGQKFSFRAKEGAPAE